MHTDFTSYLQSQGKSKSTIAHYNRYLSAFLSHLKDRQIDSLDAGSKEVISFLATLQYDGLSNATRSIRLGVIKHFFKWQISLGERPDNPAEHIKLRGVKQKKLHMLLSPLELNQLLGSYPVLDLGDPRSNRNWFEYSLLSKQRNKAVLSVMFNQGITTREAQDLNVTDVDLREGKLFVAGSRRSNERYLELKPNQIMLLMEYKGQVRERLLQFQRSPTPRLFLPTPVVGRRYATQQLHIWKGLTRELQGLSHDFLNFKQIRASVISEWIKHYNLRQVQYMAGHRYISSTESYMVNQIEDLKEEVDKYHPF